MDVFASHRINCALWLSVQPIIDVFTHLALGHAVALLDFTFQLVAAAVDLSEIIIGQLTPFLLDLAFRGFPVPFNSIPILSLTSETALLRAQTASTNNVRTVSGVPPKVPALCIKFSTELAGTRMLAGALIGEHTA